MSKTTISILSSILLSTAIMLPVAARTIPPPHRHPLGVLARHDGGRFAEPVAKPRAGKTTKSTMQNPLRVDSGNYSIIDHPNADASYGTRVFGINEAGVVSGQYVDRDDGTFHAFLRMPDNTYPFNIQIGTNDTFVGLLNDKNEVFGSYVDGGTGLEKPWVRTKNGAVIPIEVPDGTGGAIGQLINNRGVLVGDYFDDNGAFHCFTRTRKGTITELPDAPNAGTGADQGSEGIGINNKGDIAGAVVDNNNHSIAFIRSAADGTYHPFDAPNAGSGEFQGTVAAEIDDRGWVVGQVVDSNDVMHGFIRDPSGNYTIVDAPDAGTSPGQGTVAVEHREGGWAIGEYIDSNDVSHGYYRKNNGKIVEYDPPGAGDIGTYFVISSNKAHQIAGTFKDDNAVRHGFIRDPN